MPISMLRVPRGVRPLWSSFVPWEPPMMEKGNREMHFGREIAEGPKQASDPARLLTPNM
jgi:hypothetical protein